MTMIFKLLLVLGLGCYCYELLVVKVEHGCYGKAHIRSSAIATTPNHTHQNNRSYALTLVLPKAQLRIASTGNNK